MKLACGLSDGVELQIAEGSRSGDAYPTARIQKGWLLFFEGLDLSEEAVGFGVPILKRGLQTIFPGEVVLTRDETVSPARIIARYNLNLEEKISRNGNGTINNRLVYASKNILAGLIRSLPPLRSTLTNASSLLREKFEWQTTYEHSNTDLEINITYTVMAAQGKLLVELPDVSFIQHGISEIILMNEQGAHFFDQYQDENSALLQGDEIGCWDEVTGTNGAFISSAYQLSFSLPRVTGARLYRGRELIGRRLAWSGFGYSFPPDQKNIRYEVTIRKLS